MNNTITLPDMEAFHFYMQLKTTLIVGANNNYDKLIISRYYYIY